MTSVDDSGIGVLARGPDEVVDVLFDERRIWSFWVRRDTERASARPGARFVAWPDRMSRFMHGSTRLTIRGHVSGAIWHEAEHQFGQDGPDGATDARIAFVNGAGLPISLDKSGRFSPTFDVRTTEHLEPLVQAIASLLETLADLGVPAFPAYGTLLGAVREGTFLGHDSDADLGYISSATTPVDVSRESFRLQRSLVERGFATYRYSGAAFRIDVREADGATRGLDLFAGFMSEGHLYLMGEIGVPFEPEWLYPFTTCTLSGREFPAPARPDKLLEAAYGPGWRVPDPAFKFETAPETHARLNEWFRGTAIHRSDWERTLLPGSRRAPRGKPSSLARLVARETTKRSVVLDVGAGRGHDALWLARRGRIATAYDYVPRASRGAQRVAGRADLALESRYLNLAELRSVLSEGARVARLPDGPRTIVARHVLDATSPAGREGLARFASMALRGGGRLFAEVLTGGDAFDAGLRPVSLDRLVSTLEAHGATVEHSWEWVPTKGPRAGARIGRLVAGWV